MEQSYQCSYEKEGENEARVQKTKSCLCQDAHGENFDVLCNIACAWVERVDIYVCIHTFFQQSSWTIVHFTATSVIKVTATRRQRVCVALLVTFCTRTKVKFLLVSLLPPISFSLIHFSLSSSSYLSIYLYDLLKILFVKYFADDYSLA